MSLAIEPADPTSDEARALIAALDAEMTALYAPESNHFLDPDRLSADDVQFFIARLDGRAVGCAALRLDPEGYGEVKRMYVEPALQGRGLGRALLVRLEAEARDAGLSWLRLETGARSDAAIGLYRAAGFVERPPFGDYPEDPASLHMEKSLS